MTAALINESAERTLLGAALVDGEAALRVFSTVSPTDFSLDAHRIIARAILALADSGKAVDVLTVADDLARKNQLQAVGGVAFLTSLQENLTAGLARAENLEHYASVVLDKSRRRQARAAAECLIAAADDISVDTAACLQLITDALLNIEAASHSTTARAAKDVMPELLAELDLQASNAGIVGLPTGLDGLDLATGGIRAGELWTVGALPGRGKSAFAVQTLRATVTAGIPALVFSLEMSASEMVKRFLAAQSNIPAFKIRNPSTIAKEQWPELVRAMGDTSELPLYIDGSPSLKLHELLARARLAIRRHGIKLVAVDYVRFVDAPGRDLRERLGNVANALRELAKAEHVAVLLLSQLRRPDGGINAKPDMLQLKETGDLEAHSHVVLLLYQPIGEDGSLTGAAEIIIGKNRNGAVGSLPVHFDSKRLQFFPRRSA